MSIEAHSRIAIPQDDAAAWALRDSHAVCIFAGAGGTCRVADAPDIGEHTLARMLRQCNPDCSANVADEETCVYAGMDLAQFDMDSGAESGGEHGGAVDGDGNDDGDDDGDDDDDDRPAVVTVPACPSPLRISASRARPRRSLQSLAHNVLTWLLSSGVSEEMARSVLGVYYPESQTILCSGSGAYLFTQPIQSPESNGQDASTMQWRADEQDAIPQDAAEFRAEEDGEIVFTFDAPRTAVLDIAQDLELRCSGEIAPRAEDTA